MKKAQSRKKKDGDVLNSIITVKFVFRYLTRFNQDSMKPFAKKTVVIILFCIFCDLTLATAQNNLIKTIPKFTKTTKSYEIKQTCESIVIAIDKALPKFKKIEKKNIIS